jgi:hypothetical protein
MTQPRFSLPWSKTRESHPCLVYGGQKRRLVACGGDEIDVRRAPEDLRQHLAHRERAIREHDPDRHDGEG